jgi:hypothetical protein
MPLKLRNVGVQTSFGKQHGDFCASSTGMAILFVDHLVPSLHLGHGVSGVLHRSQDVASNFSTFGRY